MVRKILFIIMMFLSQFVYAQSGADWFPEGAGQKWYFRVTPLDSLGDPVQALSVVKADSLAEDGNYQGRDGKLILSKSANQNLLPFIPYNDSLIYSINGNTVNRYFDYTTFLDSADLGDTSFISILQSLEAWYPLYNFDASVGNEYNIYSLDTTITIDGDEYPVRLSVDVERNPDENLNTVWGEYNTKKFDIKFKLSYIINIPPFPPVAVPLFTYHNYYWIAPGNWIVKGYAPETNVNLSQLGMPSFFIPGRTQELIEEPAYIFLEEPQAGEIFFTGDTVDINWKSRNTNMVKISVSSDGGENWNLIHNNYPATGGHAYWFVSGEPSDEYYVKITSVEDTLATTMNILPYVVREKPEIEITSLIAGQELEAGSEFTIEWENSHTGTLNLLVSYNNGITWDMIHENISPVQESYNWQVPEVLSDSVVIKLEDSDFPRFYDQTGIFSIVRITGVDGNDGIPAEYTLYDAYPNPFNPSTRIKFAVPEEGKVKVAVYNLLGQKMVTLVDDNLDAGYHEVVFTAQGYTSGVYFVIMETNKNKFTKKIILMK